MKLFSIVGKNLKLLTRAKGSSFVVIFGPLLIILLEGLAFNNTQSFDLRVGVYAPTYTELTNSFINDLETNKFIIEKFDAEEDCVEKIKEGTIHTCMVFPENFVIENKATNEIKYYVDNTRQNLVYQVIDAVSQNLELSEINLSTGLTSNIVNTLFQSKDTMNTGISKLVNLKKDTEDISSDVNSIKKDLDSINLEFTEVDLGEIGTRAEGLQLDAKQIYDRGLDIVDLTWELIENASDDGVDTEGFEDQLETLEDNLREQYNTTPKRLESLQNLIDATMDDLEDLESRLDSAKVKHKAIKDRLDGVKENLANLKSEIDTVKKSLEAIVNSIEAVKVTDVESIVSPFTTTIVPVASGQTRLSFLFPSLLVLVIMFIGILLSGTLVVMEKNSRAFFRTFTTATKEWYFVISTYLTSLLLLLLQVAIILGLAAYFLKTQVFVNFQLTGLVLFITITFFVMLGMGIGYLFTSQEAVTLISISIGSVLLLLSNLVLPLESISPVLRSVADYNPYVIASTLLRKSLLFRVGIFDITVRPALAWLCIYSLMVIIIILFIHKLATFKFYQKIPHIKGQGIIASPEDSYLTLNDGTVIKDKWALLKYLKGINDEKFKEHSYENKNDFTLWIRNVLNQGGLAKKLTGKTRAEMIVILERELKHEHQRLERMRKKQFKEQPPEEESTYYE